MNPMHEVSNPRAVVLGLWEHLACPMRPWWPVVSLGRLITGRYHYRMPWWPTIVALILLVIGVDVGFGLYAGKASWWTMALVTTLFVAVSLIHSNLEHSAGQEDGLP